MTGNSDLIDLNKINAEYSKMRKAMTEDHKPLPVAGYTAQPDAKVALVNEFKVLEERLLRKLDALRKERPERPPGVHPSSSDWNSINVHDPRWLAIAQTHFNEGFMALARAVFQPQRIKLPEDET